jgi:hypothetical protein
MEYELVTVRGRVVHTVLTVCIIFIHGPSHEWMYSLDAFWSTSPEHIVRNIFGALALVNTRSFVPVRPALRSSDNLTEDVLS